MQIGISLEVPIKNIINLMSIGMELIENEDFQPGNHSEFCNCQELQSLYKSILDFINQVKYSNNKLWSIEFNDGITLLAQSRCKQFYKEYENLAAVGICANNISRIHIKNNRVLDAMNEQEESILIAQLELQNLQEYKKMCKEIVSNESNNVFQIIAKFKHKLTQKFGKYKYDEQSIKEKLTAKKITQKTIYNDSPINQLFLFTSLKNDKHEKKNLFELDNNNRQNRANTQQLRLSKHWIQKSNDNQLSQGKKDKQSLDQDPVSIQVYQPKEGQFNKSNQFQTPMNASQPKQNLISDEISNFNMSQSVKKVSEKVVDINSIFSDHQNYDAVRQLQQMKFQKKIILLKLLYRKYQLASILFHYSLQQDQIFFHEIILLYSELYQDSQKFNPKNASIYCLQINILMKKAFCFARTGHTILAQDSIFHAKQILTEYQEVDFIRQNTIADKKILDECLYVDIFKNIPIEILNEKIYAAEALTYLASNQVIDASLKYVQILSSQSFYDPTQRQFALRALWKIFNHYELSTKSLLNYQQCLMEKKLEIVILIDYSSEMEPEQLTLYSIRFQLIFVRAHTISNYLLDKLHAKDLVGLYTFNDIIHQIFPLQQKGLYQQLTQFYQFIRNLLKKTLDKLLIYPGGQGNTLKILQIAANYLFDLSSNEFSKDLIRQINDNRLNKIFDSQDDFNLKLPQIPFPTNFKLTQQLKSSQSFRRTLRKTSIRQQQFQGDYNDQCIDEILKTEEKSQIELEQSFLQNDINIDEIKEEPEEFNKLKFIFLCCEGVRSYQEREFDTLKTILKKKNIHLLIFNNANQNLNMLYLKKLSEASTQSQFFLSEKELIDYIDRIRGQQFMKKIYLEFF